MLPSTRFPQHFPSNPILQAKKAVSYAESSDEDDAVFATMKARRSTQRRSRAAVPDEDDEDVYEAEANDVEEDDGMPPGQVPPKLALTSRR